MAVIAAHHGDASGSWEMTIARPGAGLPGVHRYAGYVERSAVPVRRRETPADAVTVILGLGPALTVTGPDGVPRRQGSFVAPVHPAPAITEFQGEARGIQIDLSPLAARALLGVPMAELPFVAELEDVLGPEARRLVELLREACGWQRRFALLDEALGRRMARARPPEPDVVRAWSRLRATRGRLPIGALAAELGCSRRLLAGRFRDQIGPSPKTAARIMRFRHVMHLLEHDDGRRLSEIALHCGYYDQAHLNREFRELAGTTPGAHIGARLTGHLGFGAG